MFGRGSLFEMLTDDFTQDPFFQDPLRHFSTFTGLPDPAQQMGPWSSAALPQRRGREVPIETSGPHTRQHSSSQPGVSIEEVHDNEQVPTSVHTPVVEEPDEDHIHHGSRCSQARTRPQSSALINPFQAFFDHAFGNSSPFGAWDADNMAVHTSRMVAQQGSDGIQYSQSQSSSYGPQGVAEHQMRLKDGRTGHEEMTISRQLGDKGRTVTRRRQADGRQSQQQNLHNLAENESDHFDEEWTYEAERSLPMYMRTNTATLPQASRANRQSAVAYRW